MTEYKFEEIWNDLELDEQREYLEKAILEDMHKHKKAASLSTIDFLLNTDSDILDILKNYYQEILVGYLIEDYPELKEA